MTERFLLSVLAGLLCRTAFCLTFPADSASPLSGSASLVSSASSVADSASVSVGSVLIDDGWTFSLGNAASMEADFTHGTEYFTYLCKAQSSNHSKSPIMPSFDDSAWQRVNLPHDWVVDLPYSPEASHSHGYKCVGWKYPENSVGWYRRHIFIPESDRGRQISVEFEGVFRNSEVFCNGFYLGHEISGYASRVYTLTPYLDCGGDNVLTLRCDASLEEGWYYEGAGIYRHVRLHKAGPVALKPNSLRIGQKGGTSAGAFVDTGCVSMDYVFADASVSASDVTAEISILDASGAGVDRADRLWSVDDPYLYTLKVRLLYRGEVSDEYSCRFGVRTIEFNPERGFLLNGVPLELKGANMHLDHAGVGVAVPDELWRYRIARLKEYGFNAIRCSHNCASPSMLNLCDEMGMLVIDENRQFGVNEEQLGQLRNMIDRDRNHPSVILWSIGNEEWALEHSAAGTEIALRMSEFVHSLDPSRPSIYGNSGGPELVKGVDVFGYNYIVQNPVEDYHRLYPEKCAVGTEETTGCGTRGNYRTVPEEGWMAPLNRLDTAGRVNVIEHGWKFYRKHAWALGLFYWTGMDYRGEPNPMSWPATGSQFGIFDYCGFPKDEAFYLRAAWKPEEPLVHICGPYNGEIWVYSNCSEVQLYAGRKSLGTKKMPQDGHLVWKAGGILEGRDGNDVAASNSPVFRAVGYRSGKKVASDVFPAPVPRLEITAHHSGQNGDVAIIDICSSLPEIDVSAVGAEILGWGNGNPGFKAVERPQGKTPEERNRVTVTPFNGYAQIIVRAVPGLSAPVTVWIADRTITLF